MPHTLKTPVLVQSKWGNELGGHDLLKWGNMCRAKRVFFFLNTRITKWLAQQNAVKPINDFGYKYAKYTENELAPFYSTKKKKKNILKLKCSSF